MNELKIGRSPGTRLQSRFPRKGLVEPGHKGGCKGGCIIENYKGRYIYTDQDNTVRDSKGVRTYVVSRTVLQNVRQCHVVKRTTERPLRHYVHNFRQGPIDLTSVNSYQELERDLLRTPPDWLLLQKTKSKIGSKGLDERTRSTVDLNRWRKTWVEDTSRKTTGEDSDDILITEGRHYQYEKEIVGDGFRSQIMETDLLCSFLLISSVNTTLTNEGKTTKVAWEQMEGSYIEGHRVGKYRNTEDDSAFTGFRSWYVIDRDEWPWIVSRTVTQL